MKKKFIFLLIAISISIILIFSCAYSEDNKNLQFKKQPDIQQVKPKKPVKIKLKRSAEGKYTWDITGDNVDEIVRTNRRLIKLLKIE
ncbi:MAG: hypothetical protein COY75_05975 [Nitrospirae bacterium CG_4_10_14_0_8_um_filter_41_23]|nr:hypothetical protein [Nitrospirota bacterium]OIP59267.1 MAG: hypothetical protein AUK38_06105 [Nitrospirae bacterium CG2_30_41_42]PIQ94319.1 MAG: hypothetical protein COV68_05175 [Nitrospirae bacterium CG11_big_fil_rev_8_21_14_0_20_41_14]PIV44176.1 MAG: hypothetical protein COS27_02815 [Nitrospirae bacterium CG02_land_8_20_14_3_00_41_53]PIW87303.1 MAG: hypothetical protein COZ94_06000 [Nitrospirae bacterium CG_4_8_14_3_um_filter_41_47]PIY86804.1 MAG: hypothetical protein COY75_05975 [Nitros